MKYLFLAFLLTNFFQCSSNNNNKTPSTNKEMNQSPVIDSIVNDDQCAKIKFDKRKIDIGSVDKRDHEEIFVYIDFKNSGNTPLIIISTYVSCSCLRAEQQDTKILPGANGRIKITINLKNEFGPFNKHVIIKSNAANNVELVRLIGNVK